MSEGMVSGIAIDLEKEEILLVPNLVPTKPQGFWGLPGGRIEDGESPLQAVKREAAEETLKERKNGEKKIKTAGKRTEIPRTGTYGNYTHYFYCIRISGTENLKTCETPGEVGPPQWVPLSKITSGEVKVFPSHLQGVIKILEKMAIKSGKIAFIARELARCLKQN